ncbi:MAG: hypothetical protein K8R87_10260 [Verrucomicrobia bacterium]|nr:hypothetical protein [Verrucomicrobiota bacterium]
MKAQAFSIILLCFALKTALHSNPVQSVQSKDLGTTIQVMGVLNCPLGTVISIEGEYISATPHETKTEATSFAIRVTKVNGKPLETPPIIGLIAANANKVQLPKPGEKCNYRGYESGSFIGLPPDVSKDTGIKASAEPWHFSTMFCILD